MLHQKGSSDELPFSFSLDRGGKRFPLAWSKEQVAFQPVLLVVKLAIPAVLVIPGGGGEIPFGNGRLARAKVDPLWG